MEMMILKVWFKRKNFHKFIVYMTGLKGTQVIGLLICEPIGSIDFIFHAHSLRCKLPLKMFPVKANSLKAEQKSIWLIFLVDKTKIFSSLINQLFGCY